MAREGSDFSGSDVAYPPAGETSSSRAIAPVLTPNYPLTAPGFGPAPPRGPEILSGGFNQTWLANCLRRRWLMATAMGLLIGSLVAMLLMYLFPETHLITAYLQVKSNSENNVFDDSRDKPSPQDIERQAMNHLALLKSQMVLDAALTRQDVAELDAVRSHAGEELLWLTSDLRVTFPGDGEILEVRYEGEEDPDQMRKVVDSVVQAYKDKVLLQDRLVLASTRTDLQAVAAGTQERLQEKMNQLKEQMSARNRIDPEVEVPRLRAEITRLENLISDTNKELVSIEIFKRLALENARSPSAMEAMVSQAVKEDPMIQSYQADLVGVQKALVARQQVVRNANDSQVKRLQASLEQTQAMIAQQEAAVAKSAREQIEKMPNEALRQAIIEHRIRYEAAMGDLKKHEQELEEATQKLVALGIRDPEMEMLEAEIASEQEITQNLQQKIGEWQIEQQARDRGEGGDSDFDKVVVIQKAAALPATNKIERYSIAGIGGLAALALTCYGIALMEFRHRRLNSPTDIDEGLGIRVLGVLPSTSLKQLGGNSLVATQVAEAIDNVRATLMHDSTSTPRQVIMVTSSQTLEGNTVVAASLALSLSRAGRRTLLVDGDLRSPSLHKLFGMALEDGFSEVLRAEIDLADAVRPTNNEGLYLLTAGVCNAEAIHLLATDQPHAIFEKLRDQFDFIVIDAPPVLGISDSLSLGQYIDGAILTVLRDHSQIRKVHKSVETLRSMGIRLVGAVVNGVPLKADRRVVRLHQSRVQQPPRLPAKAEA